MGLATGPLIGEAVTDSINVRETVKRQAPGDDKQEQPRVTHTKPTQDT